MERVLLVSSTEKGTAYLCALLKGYFPAAPALAKNGGEARRLTLDGAYDLVVINAPLPDEFGCELARRVSQSTGAGILLVARADMAAEAAQKVCDAGVFVIEKPIDRRLFDQALRFIAAAQNRLASLLEENARLHRQLQNLRLIDRAKCLLIETLGMTEPQAHRYIEQQAMDLRMTKREIAGEIIRTYEN